MSEHLVADRVQLSLELFDHGYLISGVFFSINCLLMGYLIYHSGLIPRWIGWLIGIASIGYMGSSLAHFMFPELIEVSEMIMFFTAVFAEVSLCVYLMVKGTRQEVVIAI